MTTRTLGTNLTTTLTAVQFQYGMTQLPGGQSGFLASDFAAIANAIKDDQIISHPVDSGAFMQNGMLFVPNRGVLRVLPGDFVGVDARGWPILVSADAITPTGGGPVSSWTHN